MFLELIGKFCFHRLRPSFFYALIFFPTLLILIYLFFQSLELFELEENFNHSLEKGRSALQKKRSQDRFIERYNHADPYFLDQQIESLPLLQNECSEIRSLIKHPAIARRDFLEERLEFLLGRENRIRFNEQNIRTSQNIKETEEKQRYPVQVDEEDLKRILCLVEDISIESYHPAENQPQLLIQNFRLHRQTTSLATEVFTLDMTLLKREFTP